jgi:hypothetical protein
MKLPNCEQALVQEIKLTGDLLSEENSKGKSYFYNRIGFTEANVAELSSALKPLACSGKVTGTLQTQYGPVPRLVTAYPN